MICVLCSTFACLSSSFTFVAPDFFRVSRPIKGINKVIKNNAMPNASVNTISLFDSSYPPLTIPNPSNTRLLTYVYDIIATINVIPLL